MHKAWSCLEEIPYCFWRSSIKFQGHTGKKIDNFDPNWAFPDCNSSLNSPIAMKWNTKLFIAYESCPNVFQGHLSNSKVTQNKKLLILTRIEGFRTVTLSLNSPMALKWCTKLNVVQKRCPIVFQGHPSTFKVTRDKKLLILTQIERFWTVTPVWIDQLIWNDAQSLT